LGRGLHQPPAGIGDDEPHALESAIAQMPQKAAPAFQILFFPFGDTEDLPITVGTDADRHQHGDITNLPRPAPLDDHPVEVRVGKFAGDLAVARGFDVAINLLIWPSLSSEGTIFSRSEAQVPGTGDV